jgi:lactate racemase
MKFDLLYGSEEVKFEIPDGLFVQTISAVDLPAVPNPLEIVRNAIQKPLGDVNLDYSKIKSVSIAINDKTRPVPHQYLLPPLLDELIKHSILPENIQFIIAVGTHIPMSKSEFSGILSESILNQYDVISHDCDQPANLIHLGLTKRGTPVLINKNFIESDLKIVVGNIEPHHFMGFSGGVKSASIGLAGRETINRNHELLLDPDSRIGEYENNPMRQEIEEIGKKIGIQLALNAILNNKKQIVKAFFGDPHAVILAGIQDVRKICQTEVDQLFDLVIASAGGYPRDINLYQAQKALTNAAQIVRPGGIIILLAECKEGIGNEKFEKFMQGVNNSDEVIEKFRSKGFEVGPHKAFMIARVVKKAQVFLISSIKSDRASKLLLTPANSLDQALAQVWKILPEKPSIALMPKAVITMPIFGKGV